MRLCAVRCWMVVVMVVAALTTTVDCFSFLDEEDALLAVELAESDYVALCADYANATWAWLLNPTRINLKRKLQADEDLAQTQRSDSDSLREFSDPSSLQDAGLRERVVLASTPGTARLSLPEYRKVITFAARSHNITHSQAVPCYNSSANVSSGCSWDWLESQRVLSSSHQPYLAHHAWLQWHRLFLVQAEEFQPLQELLAKAADRNGAANIYQYWHLLTDFPEAERNATWLWEGELQQLYGNLKNFVLDRLRFQYGRDMVGDDDLLPLHLLGSFVGDDWLRIADLVTPAFHEAYKNLSSGLKKKGWGGQHLYEVAAGVGSKMGLPSLKKTPFWENAHFNGSCPATVVPWCSQNFVRVHTCDEISLHAYLDAHRVTMRALLHQLSVRNGRYILRQLNRHSALQEALMGLGELIGMSEQQLVRLGVLTEAGEDTSRQLKLLVALRTLPRLAHALAADNWRAEGVNSSWNSISAAIKGVRPPRDISDSWEIVQDSRVALNQPYLGIFAGIILQFQLFEKLVGDNISEMDNPVDIIKRDGLLRRLMVAGMSAPWTEVVNQELRIHALDIGPLLRYFEPIKSLLLAGVPSDTPRVADFERLPLPPDVPKELSTEASVATGAVAPSVSPTVSSRSQEIEMTNTPLEVDPEVSPLPDSKREPQNQAASQIILICSLSLIALGAGTGALLLGRHCYHKKRQRERRNRRPN